MISDDVIRVKVPKNGISCWSCPIHDPSKLVWISTLTGMGHLVTYYMLQCYTHRTHHILITSQMDPILEFSVSMSITPHSNVPFVSRYSFFWVSKNLRMCVRPDCVQVSTSPPVNHSGTRRMIRGMWSRDWKSRPSVTHNWLWTISDTMLQSFESYSLLSAMPFIIVFKRILNFKSLWKAFKLNSVKLFIATWDVLLPPCNKCYNISFVDNGLVTEKSPLLNPLEVPLRSLLIQQSWKAHWCLPQYLKASLEVFH